MSLKLLITLMLASAGLVPASAQTAPSPPGIGQQTVPAQLSPAERGRWRAAFLEIDSGRPAAARDLLAAEPAAVLAPTLQARLWLARRPGASELPALLDWLARNGDHPDAARVASLAQSLGATDLPPIVTPRKLSFFSYKPSTGPRATRSQMRESQALIARMKPLIASGQPALAEAAWNDLARGAEPEVRAEWAQRLAWDYYLDGNDVAAARMGAAAATERAGEWAAMGHWVAGLAAWRGDDCKSAATHFDAIHAMAVPGDLAAAGAYWASRAHMACGAPQMVSERLHKAARHADSFYGLLAQRALGLAPRLDWSEPDFIRADWVTLSNQPGARRAAALVEIGQLGLADRELKHLAAVCATTSYDAVLRLAARLNLPATQYWLATHPPAGSTPPMAARFPAPEWTPARGWRVDQALVYAHALQESNFETDAVSRAGARGLMQLMPGTAAKMKRDHALDPDRSLGDPAFNIELGQSYLEELRDSGITRGLLPKVIAAYNAGPGSVQKWNGTLRDKGDPLLFIESIPFRETRHYVEVVLRNYWMYQMRNGEQVTGIDAMAAGLWPRFPGLPGATAVRLDSSGSTASAH